MLDYIKYRDTSIITRIYTDELGLQSYLVNGVRSKKNKMKIALFQPLTLLDMVVYYRKDRQQLNRISEVKCYAPFFSIPYDNAKLGIALFIAEMLRKTLKEEDPNPDLFLFLETQIQLLDHSEKQFHWFHLYFLMGLSRFLGFAPSSGQEIFRQIRSHRPIAHNLEAQADMEAVFAILRHSFHIDSQFNSYRSAMIDYLLDFYRLHIEHIDPIRSLSVLRSLNQ